ncbi:acetyl-/propionyl-coenzyme A carboxylase alpha chain [bacterium BMS3Bbin01]|nr:acetyl-/propionyl-coenzyme A carboxylase alpha chain [bacterium BMS3Bbin01]
MRTLLIANRGEIVARIARTARRLGIIPVGVYSDPDRDSPALTHLDAAVHLAGATAADTYLDGPALIDAARRLGADAIHSGFGFLAENAGFASSVLDAGLIWVGPSPQSIAAMGDKLEAIRRAAAVGVPVLPSIRLDDALDLTRVSTEIGFPALVKAAAGGGGKGMRRVERVEELEAAIAAAGGEALRNFGDGTLYLERLVSPARHVEVQVFGDRHGDVIHLFERECSIQRRHQKIIEEAPAPGLGGALRDSLLTAAVSLAESLDYENAGTVEFVVGEDDFAFIEMNTRLQVEHPVTEEITGLDLVEWQLRVARGEPLPATQDEVHHRGHAIEARLYAEDPATGWAPGTGRMVRYRRGPGLARYEESLRSGMVISPYYDPMIAKVITHCATRSDAAAVLASELEAMHLHGPVTNRDFLVATLRHPAFLEGFTTTDFIGDHPGLLDAGPEDATHTIHRAAALWARTLGNRDSDRHWGLAPAHWRNVPAERPFVVLDGHRVEYVVHENRVVVAIDGARDHEATIHDDGATVVEIDGVATPCEVHLEGGNLWVNSPRGQSLFVEQPRFEAHDPTIVAGGPMAPIPGTVTAVLVSAGDEVDEHSDLVIIEAMKMEHRIRARGPAVVVEVLVAPGDQVDAGAVLVHLEERE